MKGAGTLCPEVREIRCPLSAERTLRGAAVRPSDNRLDKPDGTSAGPNPVTMTGVRALH